MQDSSGLVVRRFIVCYASPETSNAIAVTPEVVQCLQELPSNESFASFLIMGDSALHVRISAETLTRLLITTAQSSSWPNSEDEIVIQSELPDVPTMTEAHVSGTLLTAPGKSSVLIMEFASLDALGESQAMQSHLLSFALGLTLTAVMVQSDKGFISNSLLQQLAVAQWSAWDLLGQKQSPQHLCFMLHETPEQVLSETQDDFLRLVPGANLQSDVVRNAMAMWLGGQMLTNPSSSRPLGQALELIDRAYSGSSPRVVHTPTIPKLVRNRFFMGGMAAAMSQLSDEDALNWWQPFVGALLDGLKWDLAGASGRLGDASTLSRNLHLLCPSGAVVGVPADLDAALQWSQRKEQQDTQQAINDALSVYARHFESSMALHVPDEISESDESDLLLEWHEAAVKAASSELLHKGLSEPSMAEASRELGDAMDHSGRLITNLLAENNTLMLTGRLVQVEEAVHSARARVDQVGEAVRHFEAEATKLSQLATQLLTQAQELTKWNDAHSKHVKELVSAMNETTKQIKKARRRAIIAAAIAVVTVAVGGAAIYAAVQSAMVATSALQVALAVGQGAGGLGMIMDVAGVDPKVTRWFKLAGAASVLTNCGLYFAGQEAASAASTEVLSKMSDLTGASATVARESGNDSLAMGLGLMSAFHGMLNGSTETLEGLNAGKDMSVETLARTLGHASTLSGNEEAAVILGTLASGISLSRSWFGGKGDSNPDDPDPDGDGNGNGNGDGNGSDRRDLTNDRNSDVPASSTGNDGIDGGGVAESSVETGEQETAGLASSTDSNKKPASECGDLPKKRSAGEIERRQRARDSVKKTAAGGGDKEAGVTVAKKKPSGFSVYCDVEPSGTAKVDGKPVLDVKAKCAMRYQSQDGRFVEVSLSGTGSTSGEVSIGLKGEGGSVNGISHNAQVAVSNPASQIEPALMAGGGSADNQTGHSKTTMGGLSVLGSGRIQVSEVIPHAGADAGSSKVSVQDGAKFGGISSKVSVSTKVGDKATTVTVTEDSYSALWVAVPVTAAVMAPVPTAALLGIGAATAATAATADPVDQKK